ncbi:MAG: hypothetical protein E6Q99_02360, partial [Elusimicrobia bacterium]
MNFIFTLIFLFLASCHKESAISINIQPGGCMIYWAREPEPICVLLPAPDDRLTLTITSTPLASLSLAADDAAIFQGSIPVDGVLTLPWS